MKVSYKWLKTLADLEGISYDELVRDLSLHIVEVDAIDKLAKGTNLVVAKVLEKVMHPNSDHLSICQVDTGNGVLQVVCGAPNVAAGQKVILALPGAVLEGGTIKQGVIRGVESNGMICSLGELNLENKYIPEEFQNGIYVLPEDAPLGKDALEYLGLDDDIIELGLTPNRMDLLSMNGVANDVCAFYGRKRIYEECNLEESDKPASSEVEVELQTPDCLTYNARVIKNVEIKESPTFIKSRLMASGIRPINNVVDITNYILMLFGQPLHAFDQDILGNKIVVRNAYQDEIVKTLDDVERKLSSDDIVITDGKEVVCVAGVMGCQNTEVTSNTKNIVLEAAVFNPQKVRKTSSKLALRSESSVRFERGVDLNQTVEAIDYAAYLLSKYASGTVLNGVVHQGIDKVEDKVIELTDKDITKYLGISIERDELIRLLSNLGFKVSVENETYYVSVPNRRLDISIKADIIEELARLHGYEFLQETLPKMNNVGELTVEQKRLRTIRHTLSDLGMNEVNTYALVSKKYNSQFTTLHKKDVNPIKLMHPMSEEHEELRLGLIPSIIEVAAYNIARKNNDLALYEIGSRYYEVNNETHEEVVLSGLMTGTFNGNMWNGGKEKVDFYLVKGLLKVLEERLGIEFKYSKLANVDVNLHPGRSAEIRFQNEVIGYVSALHPAYTHEVGLNDTYVFEILLSKILKQKSTIIKFTPLIKKPTITRDLAFVMEKKTQVGELCEAIKKTSRDIISKVEVFDLYESAQLGNNKSVAISISFESDDNLTDEIINAKIKKILEVAESKFGATLRN